MPDSPLGDAAKQYVKYAEIMKKVKVKLTEAEDDILREMHAAGVHACAIPFNNTSFRFIITKGKEKLKCEFAGPAVPLGDGGGLF